MYKPTGCNNPDKSIVEICGGKHKPNKSATRAGCGQHSSHSAIKSAAVGICHFAANWAKSVEICSCSAQDPASIMDWTIRQQEGLQISVEHPDSHLSANSGQRCHHYRYNLLQKETTDHWDTCWKLLDAGFLTRYIDITGRLNTWPIWWYGGLNMFEQKFLWSPCPCIRYFEQISLPYQWDLKHTCPHAQMQNPNSMCFAKHKVQ